MVAVSRRQSPGADDLSLSVEVFSFRLLQDKTAIRVLLDTHQIQRFTLRRLGP